MKFGVLTDLHLGSAGSDGAWHNRLLFDRAEEIARSAVAELNRQNLDAVFALGDITQSGLPHQVELARGVLLALAAPWFAVPGNHDRAAVASNQFDRAFAGHTLPLFSRLGELGVVCLREDLGGKDLEEDTYRLGGAQIEQALAAVEAERPQALLVLSHFPLLEETAWASQHAGKDAGWLADGAQLVDGLRQRIEGRAAILCGHQHWHHILEGPGWIQCVTASLIEVPMEVRAVAIDVAAGLLSTTTIAAASSELVAASLSSAAWVRGREGDRVYSARIGPARP